jgi:oxygen-independent coproporphyrinogen-3 oxidase
MRTLGLYIPIPFCLQKCAYCDFLSFKADEALVEAYLTALLDEIREQGEFYREFYCLNTIFIGGGTPTLLRHDQIAQILAEVFNSFWVLKDCEITIEANPGAFDARVMDACLRGGVNRLSIGAQSLNDRLLRTLGRIHTREDFLDTYRAARRAGFDNVNVDMIFGFPGQSPREWESDLNELIGLAPEHISFYSLQLEEGTPMFEAVQSGLLKPTDDVTDRAMYRAAVAAVKGAGYEHYEISNAAKPDFRCRHNLKYWSLEEYLGVGLGAHSFLNWNRSSNFKDIGEYIEAVGSDYGFMVWEHENSVEDIISEYIFLGLRKTEGISTEAFFLEFQEDVYDKYGGEIKKFMNEGLLEKRGGMLRLTPAGIDISNRVFAEFV